MQMFLAPLLSLLASLPGTLGDYFKGKQQLEQMKIETQKQIELEKQKLAAVIAQAEEQKSSETLKATGQYFKYFTFIMWCGPFMVGLVAPDLGQKVFNNLAGMPEWYASSVVLIMFTIWGISSSAPVVGSIFSGLQAYFENKREYKLEVKRLAIDKKSFYEGLRAAKGIVSDADVKKYDAVIDKLNQ